MKETEYLTQDTATNSSTPAPTTPDHLVNKPLTFIPKGWVNIKGPNSFCINDTPRGEGLVQGICGQEPKALWRFRSYGGKYVIIGKSNRVINNKLGLKNDGNQVISMVRHNGYNQKWYVEFLKDGAFMLKNYYSEKCVDNSDSSKLGSIYIQWECKLGYKNQIFYLIDPFWKPPTLSKLPVDQKIAMNLFKMPVGWVNLLGQTGLCVTETGKGTQLQQKKCSEKDENFWRCKKIATDVYTVTSRTGKVLTNNQSLTKNGNPVISWEDLKGNNQKWNVITLSNGKILLRNPEAAKCLDIDGNVKEGANHILYECSNTKDSQMLAIKSESEKEIYALFPQQKED